jgi:hypothetical protein
MQSVSIKKAKNSQFNERYHLIVRIIVLRAESPVIDAGEKLVRGFEVFLGVSNFLRILKLFLLLDISDCRQHSDVI